MGVTLQLFLGAALILSQYSTARRIIYRHAREAPTLPLSLALPPQNATEINNRDLNRIEKAHPKTETAATKSTIGGAYGSEEVLSRPTADIDDNNSTLDNDETQTEKIKAFKLYPTSNEVGKERDSGARSIDAESSKFWPNGFFHSSSTDSEKFYDNDEFDFPTTRGVSFDIHHELTTPQIPAFDKKYKEAVESVNQSIDEFDSDEDGMDELKEVEVNAEEPRNGTLEYIKSKTIVNNETVDKNSIHKDIDLEETKNISFESVYNDTKTYDVTSVRTETTSTSTTSTTQKPTTPKNLFTKTTTIRNNSDLLSNKIESETIKPVATSPSVTKVHVQVTSTTSSTSTSPSRRNVSPKLDIVVSTTTSKPFKVNITEPIEYNQVVPLTLSEKPNKVKNNNKTFVQDSSAKPTTTTLSTIFSNSIPSKTISIDITTTTTTTTTSTTTSTTTTTTTNGSALANTTQPPETTTIETSTETTETTPIFSEDTTATSTGNDSRTSKYLKDRDVTEPQTTTEVLRTTTFIVDSTTLSNTTETDSSTTEPTESTTPIPTTTSTAVGSTATDEGTTLLTTKEADRNVEFHSIVTEEIATQFTLIPTRNFDGNHSTATTTSETLGPNLNYSSSEPVEVRIANVTSEYVTSESPLTNGTTTEDDGTTDTTENGLSTDNGPSKRTVAAIVISTVGAVCLVLLAGLLYIMRKRQKRFNYGPRCTPVSLDEYSIDNLSVYNSVRRKGAARMSKRSFGNPAFEDPVVSHPLNFPALAKFATNFDDVKAEFEEIPQISARTSELPEGCDSKNRYANVIPLPETRVFLIPMEGYQNSDYINANYVRGPKNCRAYYIATQGPMQNTVDDFWRMVWEQQSKVILMITHLVENGLEKCVDYLPESEVLDNHRMFGDFQVTLKKREVKDKYIISTLQLKNMVSNSWREVTHFWYLGWPDKGVPTEGNSLIAFLIEARSYMKTATIDRKNEANGSTQNGDIPSDHNPVVVHCSPGTGRTGVVIACDIAIREFETTRLVDIPKIVYGIRRDRAATVQTKEQYQFIYKVVSLYATKLTGGALENF